MQRILSLTLIALSLSIIAANAAVIKVTPSAYSNGTTILVRWLTEDESGVVGFEIARKAGASGSFVVLTPKVQAKGDNSSYEFTDETAFRATDSFYQYRITVLYSDGRQSDPFFVVVTHSVSSVRRTWGSIKAMFR